MSGEHMSVAEIAGLIDTIAAPKEGERMVFLTDYPEGVLDEKRRGREELLQRWHAAASALSQKRKFRVFPVVKYPETGRHNANLPMTAATHDGGHVNDLPAFLASASIAIAMTEYSATAPLRNISTRPASSLRVISMPGVSAEMEGAMSADYVRIAERGKRLLAVVQSATGFEIVFDGKDVPRGTKLYIDTRAGNWILESGMCRNAGDFINFPSGELFAPPYEGASEGGRQQFGDSQTQGTLPVYSPPDRRVAFLKVEKNRIVRVQGDSLEAQSIIDNISQDENCANIAELGFGLNEKARTGVGIPVLESEKAGPHIAYGRNDHFGSPSSLAGKVRASVHIDYVYSHNSPITATIHAVYANGGRVLIAERGKIVAV